MNKKKENSKNKLCLNLFEANLQRHPSVKGLFDEDGNMKAPTDSKDEFFILNIDNKSDEKESNDTSNINPDEENEDKDKDKKLSIPVKINRVEEKIVNNKETFFIEMNDQNRNEILKKNGDNNSKQGKPLSYAFNDSQKKFDKDVTDAMSKGKEYSEIEGKFANQLKKK
jgi:hypothetical protein